MPILARSLGATDVALSMLTSLNIGVLLVGNLMATALVRRLGARRLVYLSFLLLALGIGGAALAGSLPWIFAFQFCIGLSMGIGYPVLMGMSIQHVEEAERTTAMGLHQATYAIGMFSGPGISGAIAEAIGIRPMFGITAGMVLMMGILGAKRLR